jgi:hypothetical protein
MKELITPPALQLYSDSHMYTTMGQQWHNNYFVLLDTVIYKVELAYGTPEEYYANIITENLKRSIKEINMS